MKFIFAHSKFLFAFILFCQYEGVVSTLLQKGWVLLSLYALIIPFVLPNMGSCLILGYFFPTIVNNNSYFRNIPRRGHAFTLFLGSTAIFPSFFLFPVIGKFEEIEDPSKLINYTLGALLIGAVFFLMSFLGLEKEARYHFKMEMNFLRKNWLILNFSSFLIIGVLVGFLCSNLTTLTLISLVLIFLFLISIVPYCFSELTKRKSKIIKKIPKVPLGLLYVMLFLASYIYYGFGYSFL